MVKLNQVVAIAYSGKCQEAIHHLNALEGKLKNYQPFYAARAAIAQQLEDLDSAILDYAQAIKLSKNNAERDFLSAEKSKLEQVSH